MEIINKPEQVVAYAPGETIFFDNNGQLGEGVIKGTDPDARALIVTPKGSERPKAILAQDFHHLIRIEIDESFFE